MFASKSDILTKVKRYDALTPSKAAAAAVRSSAVVLLTTGGSPSVYQRAEEKRQAVAKC